MLFDELIIALNTSNSITLKALANNLSKLSKLYKIDKEAYVIKLKKAQDFLNKLLANFLLGKDVNQIENLINTLSEHKKIPITIENKIRINEKIIDDILLDFDEQKINSESTDFKNDIKYITQNFDFILNWFIVNIVPEYYNEEDIIFLHGTDITQKMMREMASIDKQLFPLNTLADINLYYSWQERNPDIYTVAIDMGTNKVVGYINAMPIEDDLYNSYLKDNLYTTNDLHDEEIQPKAIKQYDLPGIYKLLFCSIAIDPDYQKTQIYRYLIDAFIDKLLRLTEREIYISEMIADAVNETGEKLCNHFGMEKVLETHYRTTVYKSILLPPSLKSITKKSIKLFDLYKIKYAEINAKKDIENVKKNDKPLSSEKLKYHSIYFSYAWDDNISVVNSSREKIIDELYKTLTEKGYNLKRDKMDLGYRGLISEFMKEIGQGKLIIIALSEKYLKSPYCMFELYEIYRNSKFEKKEFSDKIFPIHVEIINLNDPDILDDYLSFWEEKKKAWESLIQKRLDKIGAGKFSEYDKVKQILENFGDLTSFIADINAQTPGILSENNFEKIIISIDEKLNNF